MKFLASVVVVLMAALALAVYHAANLSITIDHLQMSELRLKKREACLLRLGQSFMAAMKPGELRPWIQKNQGDLEMAEEKARIRVNEVVFDLNVPASIE